MSLVLLAASSSEHYRGRSNVLVLRSAYASRRTLLGFTTGFLEPLFYLTTWGVGLGAIVGSVRTADGNVVGYAAFIAPALLASTTMNAAIHDLSVGFYFKLRHERIYDAVLATPAGIIDVVLGETLWTAIRATLYAAAFLVAMYVLGVVGSPWAIFALPAAFGVAFAFGLLAMAGTTFMRTWSDTQLVQLATVPMLLLGGTFYPIEVYAGWLRPVIELMPLYQANVLMRSIVVGAWPPQAYLATAYLLALGCGGAFVTVRRMQGLLLY